MNETRITSRKNPTLQHIRRLLSSRAYREQTRQFAADGIKLLDEAIKWYPGLDTVVLSDGVEIGALPERVRLIRVPEDVMQSISPMQAPQGALFTCTLPEQTPFSLQAGTLILDGIQDPGNVGAILRTADALEVPAVLTEGCADPYNHKTVRASMGAVFRTPPRSISRQALLEQCRTAGIPLAVTVLSDTAVDLRSAALQKCAVVIGSEGRGVDSMLLQGAQMQFIIPMNPRCESLNAAVAAAIVMWQMKTK